MGSGEDKWSALQAKCDINPSLEGKLCAKCNWYQILYQLQ